MKQGVRVAGMFRRGPLLAGLLAVVAFAPTAGLEKSGAAASSSATALQNGAAAPAAPTTGMIEVKYDNKDRLLSVKAENADLEELLHRIDRVVSWPLLRFKEGMRGKVTIDISRMPVREAIDKILRDQAVRYRRLVAQDAEPC